MRRFEDRLRRAGTALLCVALLSACGAEEELRPLYEPVPFVMEETFSTNLTTEIPTTIIKPSLLRRITGALFGWIPVVGSLVHLPLDLASSLLPSLEAVSHPDMPKDSRLSDPEILDRLTSLRIRKGHLKIVPEALRGPGYKPKWCWFRRCKDKGLTFLDEIRIYMVFARPHQGQASGESTPVLIGSAKQANYDRKNRVLPFLMTDVDLKPYFAAFRDYRVQVVASGSFPKHDIYLGGGFQIEATFHLR